MSSTPPATDDLSGGGTPDGASATANQILLDDATARRWYRNGATATAVIVIGFLLYAMCLVTNTLMLNLSRITPSVVAIVSVIVVAVSVLAIALLRSTFAPADRSDETGVLTAPSLEALKELREAAGTVIDAIKGKP